MGWQDGPESKHLPQAWQPEFNLWTHMIEAATQLPQVILVGCFYTTVSKPVSEDLSANLCLQKIFIV